MIAAENLDLLTRQDWEGWMKEVFKEAALQFKSLKKNILDYHKEIEKARKAAEHEVKKAVTAAERAVRARGHVRGNRGGGGGRGQG
jgi:hypothetical protein